MLLSRRQLLSCAPAILTQRGPRRPNILVAIADDWSWPHASVAGGKMVRTPAFDRVAERGVLFTNAICASPGCAPSRAAILTGRPPWQLEEAGTHASLFPKKFQVYPDLLEAAGYFVGLTGKGAGPCNWKDAGWSRNPAGPAFDARTMAAPKGISQNDYAANFAEFLKARPKDRPFCFWYGGHEPHRVYDAGAGLRAGKQLDVVRVPPFLPDCREVRSDLLDYAFEMEWFDRHLGRMLDLLQQAGELENTLVLVTADNGMPFPSAKANLREYGIHLPLAVCWPARVKGGRTIEDLISFMDFAPTFLEAAGIPIPEVMTGRSFWDVLTSGKSGRVDPKRTQALSGRERHSHARYDNLGYPSRALRTPDYLYVRNFKPELFPAGDPPLYADIDDSPSKRYILDNRDLPLVRPFFDLACAHRPAEELYDIRNDPGCTKNLAESAAHKDVLARCRAELERLLRAQQDPRVIGGGDIFDSYPRFSPMRPELGGFAAQGEYNPNYRPR